MSSPSDQDQNQGQQQPPPEPWWEPKTFKVTSALSGETAAYLEAFDVLWLVPLKVGDFGIIYTGGNNSLDDGGLIDYPIVQLLRETDQGIEAGYGTTLLEGRAGLCQVPRENIELGAFLTGPGRVSLMPGVENPPRLQFTSTFKNFDCFVPCIRNLDYLDATNIWIRTKAPPTIELPAIWSFGTPRHLRYDRNRGQNPRVQLFYTQWSEDSMISLFEANVPRRSAPPNDRTAVYLIVEITVDPDVEHPHAYIPHRQVCPFDSGGQALRVGIRIEFIDEGGNWHTSYLSASTRRYPILSKYKSLKVEELGNELNHIDIRWLHCMKTLATLLNWRWKPEDNITQAVWAPYRIRLLSIDFDFHNQRLVLNEPQPVEMQCPRLLA
ncbi:hypothetical protein FPANT_10535 [Fusarium pseudoanthophilum]|uniref:Uncharacterized protein n=1 Tax=Fusarium pseudoanthophilum TaxID=48495 RepID=A0A8H5KMX7_9HYPO|nr:hypothetical protein FPANT_10535 [Fusarium pseudoanthophilum]